MKTFKTKEEAQAALNARARANVAAGDRALTGNSSIDGSTVAVIVFLVFAIGLGVAAGVYMYLWKKKNGRLPSFALRKVSLDRKKPATDIESTPDAPPKIPSTIGESPRGPRPDSPVAPPGSPRESILDQAHAQIFPDEEDEGSNVAVAGSRVATNYSN